MSSYNDQDTHIKDLEAVLDEYASWFMEAVKRIFYPERVEKNKSLSAPVSFEAWANEAEKGKLIEPQTLTNLRALERDLRSDTTRILRASVDSQEIPTYDEFEKLSTFFEEFINFIRRIEKDNARGEVGVDPVTGLRRIDMFFKDIRLEMDRLARQGKAFTLAIVRIDSYERLAQNFSQEEMDDCLRLVVECIRKCMRSFDDAYRMDGEFLLSLKQTGIDGGIKALNRLKRELQDKNKIYQLPDGPVRLTLSSCVAEPLAEDDPKQVLENIQKDMDRLATTPETIIEYVEMSALQRFVAEESRD